MSITPREIEWAAGFLEGEGSFVGPKTYKSSLAVSVHQKQRGPLEKLQRLLGGNICQRGVKHKGIYAYSVYGSEAAGVMMTIFSLMSPWRKIQITTALTIWKNKKQKRRTTRVA